MSVTLDIQRASQHPAQPSDEQLEVWMGAALHRRRTDETELTIRIVDEGESASLNEQFRGKSNATNVLSFPFEGPEGMDIPLLGDLVICAPVVATEAEEQQKSHWAHWAHMVVHGCLHLLGYDHIQEDQAEQMEALEIEILKGLGFSNPYLEQEGK